MTRISGKIEIEFVLDDIELSAEKLSDFVSNFVGRLEDLSPKGGMTDLSIEYTNINGRAVVPPPVFRGVKGMRWGANKKKEPE